MSKKTQVLSETHPNWPINKEAIDTVEFCHSCIYDLGSLFKAIRDTSKKYSTTHDLAEIGMYLANDWSNNIDITHKTLIELLNNKNT
ncbi:MAG: hypothetical protein ABW170_06340 [Candidatus Thiodiazotropha sp. L084R]